MRKKASLLSSLCFHFLLSPSTITICLYFSSCESICIFLCSRLASISTHLLPYQLLPWPPPALTIPILSIFHKLHSLLLAVAMVAPTNDGSLAARPKRAGRRKLEMKRIEKLENRQVCFSKRRSGIFTKAGELSILCGAQILVIVFSMTNKAFVFATPSVESVIKRFSDPQSHVSPGRDGGEDVVQQALLREHSELVKQMGSEKKRRAALMNRRRRLLESGRNGDLWFADVKNLAFEQLQKFMAQLQQMKATLENREAYLRSRMAVMPVPSALTPQPFASTAGPSPSANPFPSPLLDSMQVPPAVMRQPSASTAGPSAPSIPFPSPSLDSLPVPSAAKRCTSLLLILPVRRRGGFLFLLLCWTQCRSLRPPRTSLLLPLPARRRRQFHFLLLRWTPCRSLPLPCTNLSLQLQVFPLCRLRFLPHPLRLW